MSPRTGQDYKLSDKEEQREQGESDKQSGSLRPGAAHSGLTPQSILNINDVVCPEVDQKHLFKTQEASRPSPTTGSP